MEDIGTMEQWEYCDKLEKKYEALLEKYVGLLEKLVGENFKSNNDKSK